MPDKTLSGGGVTLVLYIQNYKGGYKGCRKKTIVEIEKEQVNNQEYVEFEVFVAFKNITFCFNVTNTE